MDGMQSTVELEEGWAVLQIGITKLINALEAGEPESQVDAGYYMKMYTTVYSMCTQKPPHDYSEDLYERYKAVYNDYLCSRVLPAIQEKSDDGSMLQELVKRWANHKVMVSKLCGYFSYLDRCYVPRSKRPSLKYVGFGCFRRIVAEEMKVWVKDALISLINQGRQGEKTEKTLLKNVLDVFFGLCQ